MSNGQSAIKWRFLIVEDNDEIIRLLKEIVPSCVDFPDQVEVSECKRFRDAAVRLKSERFDLLILDLKDDSGEWFGGEDDPAGLKIFAELKKTRFAPVVFYTAFAHKVLDQQTSFVRVVKKPDPVTKVRDEVRRVLATRLPALNRHVEELQRSYMWDFVNTHWKDFTSPHDQADIAYLLARQLALSLQLEARRLARTIAGRELPLADPANIHPMEMYVPPPLGQNRLAGDIVRGSVTGEMGIWLILTPSCDFEQKGRLRNVLLARCFPLAEQSEFRVWKQNPSAITVDPLKALIQDARKDTQPERFKFLPGTFFLEDSVVDFQMLKMITPDDLSKLEVIASLDSPFAEAVVARFARYFGRLGTPDVDKQVVINRLQSTGTPEASEKRPPPA